MQETKQLSLKMPFIWEIALIKKWVYLETLDFTTILTEIV